MTRQRAWALTHTQMVPSTRANGLTINSMVKELSHGLMVQSTRVVMRTARKRARVGSLSLTEATTRVRLSTTRSVDSVTTTGQMANHMQATGARTKWTAKENCVGRTARCTKVNSSTIKERTMELSCGLMAANTLVSGKQESSTESAHTSVRRALRSAASGKMVARSAGSTTKIRTIAELSKTRKTTISTEPYASLLFSSFWKTWKE